jgi:hypothetical protein
MLKTFGKKFFFYYDLEKKTIARFPTKSNLLLTGSDNSLFFGLKTNKDLCELMATFFDQSNINKIAGLSYDFQVGDLKFNVIININDEGQIQIKIGGNGTMGTLAENYAFSEMKQIDFSKMLIVVDFINKEVRFKDPNDLSL